MQRLGQKFRKTKNLFHFWPLFDFSLFVSFSFFFRFRFLSQKKNSVDDCYKYPEIQRYLWFILDSRWKMFSRCNFWTFQEWCLKSRGVLYCSFKKGSIFNGKNWRSSVAIASVEKTPKFQKYSRCCWLRWPVLWMEHGFTGSKTRISLFAKLGWPPLNLFSFN